MSGPTPSLQYAWDGPGALGAGQDAQYLRWNNTTGRFEMASAGVSDHGGLTGLSDDDHAQYALLAGRSGGQTLNLDTASGGAGTINASAHATKGALTLGASQVLAPAGTGAAPGLAFSGDTDTGFYRSTTDRIAVSLGGVAWHTLGAAFASFMNQTTFSTNVAGTAPVIVRGAAAQTANLQEWQDSAATVLAHVKSDGRVAIGALTLGATLASGGSFVWRMSGGSDTFAFQNGSSAPYLTLSNTATNQLLAAALSAAKVPLTVDGFASQSANLTEWRNSAGTVLLRVTSAGYITSGSGSGSAGLHAWNWTNGGGFYSPAVGATAFLANNARECIRISEVASAAAVGFFGATPVNRPTALTAANAGALNTGDAGSDTVIGNMRTRIGELETKLQALGLLT